MTSSRRNYILLLVLASLVISTALGLRQSLGLFMQPMSRRPRHLGREPSASPSRCRTSSGALSQPFVGALADRYGARPVLVGTALVYARACC